eukprot:1857378-Prymnesium_polylepis.1
MSCRRLFWTYCKRDPSLPSLTHLPGGREAHRACAEELSSASRRHHHHHTPTSPLCQTAPRPVPRATLPLCFEPPAPTPLPSSLDAAHPGGSTAAVGPPRPTGCTRGRVQAVLRGAGVVLEPRFVSPARPWRPRPTWATVWQRWKRTRGQRARGPATTTISSPSATPSPPGTSLNLVPTSPSRLHHRQTRFP